MNEKLLAIVTLIFFIGVIIIVGICMVGTPSNEKVEVKSLYADAYFNPNTINTVSITISEKNWNDMFANPTVEEYHICDIEINGDPYTGTAIRTKGQITLKMLAKRNSDRYSFKIKADEYVKNQNFKGLKEFCLNSLYLDETSMADYLSYELMTKLGVPTPLYSYAAVYINGEYYGLFLMLESVEEDFAARNFGKNYGQLYKPAYQTPGITLKYSDDNPSSYSGIFNNAVYTTTSTPASNERVIKAIKNLNQGNPADGVEVEEALKFIAGICSVVSLDSYIGIHSHNYYIYEKNGRLQIIPWDFNNAFGNFIGAGTNPVDFPINTPISSDISMEDRPLVEKLLAIDEYKELYHAYLRWVAENYFNSSFSTHIDEIEAIIGDYIKTDPTAFYTYDQHLSAIRSLKEFGEMRGKSILGQLNGTIPSTWEGQKAGNSSASG